MIIAKQANVCEFFIAFLFNLRQNSLGLKPLANMQPWGNVFIQYILIKVLSYSLSETLGKLIPVLFTLIKYLAWNSVPKHSVNRSTTENYKNVFKKKSITRVMITAVWTFSYVLFLLYTMLWAFLHCWDHTVVILVCVLHNFQWKKPLNFSLCWWNWHCSWILVLTFTTSLLAVENL